MDFSTKREKCPSPIVHYSSESNEENVPAIESNKNPTSVQEIVRDIDRTLNEDKITMEKNTNDSTGVTD